MKQLSGVDCCCGSRSHCLNIITFRPCTPREPQQMIAVAAAAAAAAAAATAAAAAAAAAATAAAPVPPFTSFVFNRIRRS